MPEGKTTRFILIGLGRLGQELLSRLSRDFSITCVTVDEQAPETLRRLKREDVELIRGDATSRLVLEKARINDADAVIISTTVEKVNLEVARILKDHFTAKRVISVGITASGVEQLTELGVEVENIFISTALDIRNAIESKTKTPHAIGIGKEEILEVEVHPNSRLANKPLGFLKPLNWRFGIVYRDGNIIVPKGDTVLKPKDKVVVLGEPQVLKSVAEMMMFNYQKFPLEYGETMVVYCSGYETAANIDEINYLFSTFPVSRAYLVFSERASREQFSDLYAGIAIKDAVVRHSALPPQSALQETFALAAENQGLVVLSGAFLRSAMVSWTASGTQSFFRRLLRRARCPVLISRGTHPYGHVAVPAHVGTDAVKPMETALEISEDLSSDITTLFVKPHIYIASEEESARYELLKKSMSQMALVYKTRVLTHELTGNPIKEVLAELKKRVPPPPPPPPPPVSAKPDAIDEDRTQAPEDGAVVNAALQNLSLLNDDAPKGAPDQPPAAGGKINLLITTMDTGLRDSLYSYFLNPDPAWRVLVRAELSALVLPYDEEGV